MTENTIKYDITFSVILSTVQVLNTATSVFLSKWSDEENQISNITVTESTFNSSEEVKNERIHNLGVYAMYHLGAGIAQVFGILMMTLAVLKSSKTLHNKTFRNILRAPMKFFDTTPQGRILNRLGKDVDVLDTNMQFSLRNAISGKKIKVKMLCYIPGRLFGPVLVNLNFKPILNLNIALLLH